ncbi:MAG: hypothetical protein ACLFU5_02970, partial [Thermoplasmata archaeon]
MLKEVKEIGEFAINNDDLEPLDIIVDQPFNDKAIKKGNAKVICIDLNLEGNDIFYEGIHIEDYDPLKSNKYLYRDHPSHRFRITPSDKVSTLDKTSWRVAYWFRKYDKYLSNELVNNLKEKVIDDEDIKESILVDIKNRYDELSADSKKNSLITFKFHSDGQKKYLGDFEIFKKILKKEGMNEFWSPDVPLKDGKCYLCEEE